MALAALAAGGRPATGVDTHLEPWGMLYSSHWCYIALTPAISISIYLIDVLYSRVLYSTCYMHVLYSIKYVLYSKKLYMREAIQPNLLYYESDAGRPPAA